MQLFHAFGVVENHMELHVDDAVLRGQKLAFTNVRVAERQRVVDIHTAAYRGACDQRRSDDEGVFELLFWIALSRSSKRWWR